MSAFCKKGLPQRGRARARVTSDDRRGHTRHGARGARPARRAPRISLTRLSLFLHRLAFLWTNVTCETQTHSDSTQFQSPVAGQARRDVEAAHGRAEEAAAGRPADSLAPWLGACDDAAQAEARSVVVGGSSGEPTRAPLEGARGQREEGLARLRFHEQRPKRHTDQRKCRSGNGASRTTVPRLPAQRATHVQERRTGDHRTGASQVKRPEASRQWCRL